MNESSRPNLSCYKTIAAINEEHGVTLVQHQDTRKIYVKKILTVYNKQIYQYLYSHKISGIPRIIDLCEENGYLTVIEEYVSGLSLQEKIDTRELSFTSVIHYMRELCDILEKLHALNPPIVHRDIKPSNILVTDHEHIVLLDFNAAKYFTDASTSDTILLGTKGYAAPEQYGFGSSTPQTDIYAMGILLRELSRALPEPAERFSSIIDRCTRLEPTERYRSAADLRCALDLIAPASAAVSAPAALQNSYAIPGFRTGKPWKMLVATVSYLFLGWTALTLDVKDVSVPALWLERFFCLVTMLTIVLFSCNYRNIQEHLPLCRHQNRILRCAGIVLWDTFAALSLMIVLVIIESLLFS